MALMDRDSGLSLVEGRLRASVGAFDAVYDASAADRSASSARTEGLAIDSVS
jgi:hypothetical protein